MTLLSIVPLVVLSSVSVQPPSVPASGSQTAIVTLNAPAMVRIAAKSGAGTACTIVDKVRGPFASSGEVGKSSCELDLLLDIGSYKLRLESPQRGKGNVAITTRPFSEQNPKPLRLEKGRRIEKQLHPGEQASFWVSLKEREVPFLHVLGKSAGEVRLWRSGDWLEPASFAHQNAQAGPNRPIHEWRFENMLEPGEYLLTAYGTNPLGGGSVDASDALTIEYGFAPLPPERVVVFTLPASGTLSYLSPKGRGAFVASLDAPPAAAFEVSAGDLVSPAYLGIPTSDGQSPAGRGLSFTSRFSLEPKKLVPQALATVENDEAHVVTLRGAPGTRGMLEWAPAPGDDSQEGGYYGAAARSLAFEIHRSGDYLIGLHDLPADTDAAPLGCQLERPMATNKKNVEIVAHDYPTVADGQKLEREWNYDGTSAIIWFEILRGERYRIETLGDRKSRCEVSSLDSHGKLTRLTQSKPDAKSCEETLNLPAGVYMLSLYGGLSGIEKLSLHEDNQRPLKPIPVKAGCLFTVKALPAGRYNLVANRTGELAARGLVLKALPLPLDSPAYLVMDPGHSLKLPVSQPGVARSAAGRAFFCNEKSVIGQCAFSPGTLTLRPADDNVVSVTLLRPTEPKPLPPLLAFDPKIAPPPRAMLDQARYFDFDRGQSHSLVFDVDKAGLYNLTTLGLLSTECRLRTPVVPDVSRDFASGRGRNCLISSYLRPGRYMMTAATSGTSRGRAGVLLTRRPPREFTAVGSDGQAFFRVGAGELLQQKLYVQKEGEFRLATTAQGVPLKCRLDDADGWPLLEVPTACSQTTRLKSGSYQWTQMPLTVESMRHTRLERVREPLVLKGNKAHAIDFHTFYTAQLGSDGKDEFLFQLEGELTIDVVLTGGMQGHVYLLSPDKPPKAVEVIPPQSTETGESAATESSESPSSDSPATDSPSDSSSERFERSENSESGGEHSESAAESPPPESPPPPPPPLHEAPPPPSGTQITLPAGQYKLVTEHSRGDVAVEYKLHLGSQVMTPGMARDLPVPVVVPVKMPKSGTLRLRTEGEADVRCRLFKGEQLMFEGADNGADWNCALAEPLAAGDYRLVIEAETQRAGSTRLALAFAPIEDGGAVRDGAPVALGSSVKSLALPTAAADAVHELSFRSGTPFSCALEDGSGQVVHRKTRVTDCSMLVRPQSERYRVRLWTTDGSTLLAQSFREKPVTPVGRGTLPGDKASQVTLAKAGRYTTSAQIFCLGGNARGLLRPCGPEASLPAGPAVFASFGPKDQPLPLDEKVAAITASATETLFLSEEPYLQAVSAAKPSLFLLSAEAQHGERAAPSCAFDTGVRESRDRACFAVSNSAASAIARAWAPRPAEAPLATQLLRRAITLPAQATPLSPGRAQLRLSRDAALFTLPRARARLEMTLPGDAWVVLLNDAGGALDLCAPIGRPDALARCVMSAQGGKLVISSSEPLADVTTVLLEAAEKSATLASLYEEVPRDPGTLRLKAPAATVDRTAEVEGDVRCTFVFSDGTRLSGCKAAAPRGLGFELIVEHKSGPLRATLYAAGRERWARLNIQPPQTPGAALPAATAVPTFGAGRGWLDRTLTIDKETVVRITADAGVCGLFGGGELIAVDGLDSGCEIWRLLPAGTYRVISRPFAGRFVPGSLRWTAEPVATLADGVGPEDFIAPAEVRVYRFSTASKGYIGLGVQSRSESLECFIYDARHKLIGSGCQQYQQLEKGSYLLTLRLPSRAGAQPLRIKPVLLGLAGAATSVPADYLKDLFRRIGANP